MFLFQTFYFIYFLVLFLCLITLVKQKWHLCSWDEICYFQSSFLYWIRIWPPFSPAAVLPLRLKYQNNLWVRVILLEECPQPFQTEIQRVEKSLRSYLSAEFCQDLLPRWVAIPGVEISRNFSSVSIFSWPIPVSNSKLPRGMLILLN